MSFGTFEKALKNNLEKISDLEKRKVIDGEIKYVTKLLTKEQKKGDLKEVLYIIKPDQKEL